MSAYGLGTQIPVTSNTVFQCGSSFMKQNIKRKTVANPGILQMYAWKHLVGRLYQSKEISTLDLECAVR